MKNLMMISIASSIFSLIFPSTVLATTTYENSVIVTAKESDLDPFLFAMLEKTTDGSPATRAGFLQDGFASAQATKDKSGTAVASASGSKLQYNAYSVAKIRTLFDFPPSKKGEITLGITGWAVATGSGYSVVMASIFHNSINVATQAAWSVESSALQGDPNPGFQSLSLTKTIDWSGGDLLEIVLTAQTDVFGDKGFPGISGPGFASAYIDPVVTLTTVPEPANWAMLIAGFGLTGAAMRRRRFAVA